jgi:hypothetical protein
MTLDQMRTLCRHFIDTMPEDGLEETLDTLRDYHAFYSTPKAEQPTVVSAGGTVTGAEQ